jgi:PAS domain S-box-containing protein
VVYFRKVLGQRLLTAVRRQHWEGRSVSSNVLWMAALAGVYFLAGKLGLKLAFLHQSASPVWPPTGIALAAVLLLGYRVWPGIWLGGFLVNVTTAGTWLTSVGIAGGNTLEALLGAWLVQRFARGRRAFDRARDVFQFAFWAAVVSTTVSATIGVTSLSLGGFADWNRFPPIWFTWWLGDMVSALLVAPVILIWSDRPVPRWTRRQIAEGVFMLASVSVVSLAVFGDFLGTPFQSYLRAFLCFPPLLWGAFRFRQHGAITAALAEAVIALWATARGLGPFINPSANGSLLLLQSFVGAVTVTGLALAATVSEHRRGQAALAESEARLQGLVDSAMDAIIAVNEDQRIVLFNPAAEEMFGCPAAEALGSSLDRFIPARSREAHRQHIQNFGKTGATNRRMGALGKLSGVRASGKEFPIEASISHLVVGGQKLFTAIVRDITERQQAEARLEEWQRELETRVQQRTAEVLVAHQHLQAEIDERKRLETEIAGVVEREQHRLGQELHDGLGQQLTGIGYLLTALHAKLKKTSPARLREMRRVQQMILECVERTRDLAQGFYPVELERLGLRSALEGFAGYITQSSGVPCVVQSDGSGSDELKGPLAIQLFRVAQEAMWNAAKHAHAKTILVRLGTARGHITLTVKDDGFGFQHNGDEPDGMGIRIMHYRARMIGGRLAIHNDPEGGVSVMCSVPCAR